MLNREVRAIAVIGANYGDEGKGAVVNALAKHHKPEYVIRFNGGGQAGHTVQLENGTRHVFSTFGSGTFYGAKTFYTEDVLVSPRRIQEESGTLTDLLGRAPSLIISPDARIVTDLDVILNQFGEVFRRDAGFPHGTCGMGVGECVLRHLEGGPSSLAEEGTISRQAHIKWFWKRIQDLLKDTGVYWPLYEDRVKEAVKKASVSRAGWTAGSVNSSPYFSSIAPTVIFEGAQGLLLDEDDPDHQPHVTWSKTGLTNVIKECKNRGWRLSNVFYVTRPYLTRHGEGPMHAENPGLVDVPGFWRHGPPVDATNVTNKWQGNFRLAGMDWEKLQSRVLKDYQLAQDAFPDRPPILRLAVTCLDHVPLGFEITKVVSGLTPVYFDGTKG